jgi:hypothetical protein
MNELRKTLPPLPDHMKGLPIDDRGYPVPFFVTWVDGKPDFRLLDKEKFVRAVKSKLCSVCGKPLGRFKSFVGGPMNVLQKISGEPPLHHACALFSVRACPFLLLPLSKRRTANLPTDKLDLSAVGEDGDVLVDENPGITSIWTCTRFYMSATGRTFSLVDVHSLEWFTEGREATREEIEAALIAGRDRLSKIVQQRETQS